MSTPQEDAVMKHPSRILSSHALHALALASGAALSLSVAAPARAQDAGDSSGAQPTLWVEPRVSAGVTLSSNGALSGTNPQSEQTLELSPGVRVVVNRPRVKGFLDYSLSGLYYAQKTSGDNLRHALNANARIDAWDNRAFVDLSGVVSDQSISALGASSSLADANRSETASFRFSPSLRGNVAGFADYEARYSLQTASTDTSDRSDLTTQDLTLNLASRRAGRPIGWSFNAALQEADYALGRRTQSDTLRAGIIYDATNQLSLSVFAGVESNDVITASRKSYSTTGLNLDWRPSPRTRVSAGVDDRYFGHGHNVLLEHRTGRTVWRYTDTRGASNNALGAESVMLRSLGSLLQSVYASQGLDSIEIDRLVQAKLRELGLPANTEVYRSFLTSSATVQRVQQLSVALVGVRDVVTLSVSRGNTRRLDAAINLGDDFDTEATVRQQSWSLVYAHRLTPITSFSTSLSAQKSAGSTTGTQTSSKSFELGLTTSLGLRTSGSVQLRRTVSDGTSTNYGETAIAGLITHRF
jgi:uncharacterized protein (PEP-CTERM system associated)